jgi:hypothetical protein
MTHNDKAHRKPEPEDMGRDPHDAGIRMGNEEALEEGGVGPMSFTTGAGGLGSGAGLGGTRDDFSNEHGGDTGAMLGGKGAPGTNLGSTDVGRSDITGEGDASGLGATNGGDTA